jgi:hypothetical protein
LQKTYPNTREQRNGETKQSAELLKLMPWGQQRLLLVQEIIIHRDGSNSQMYKESGATSETEYNSVLKPISSPLSLVPKPLGLPK